MSEALMPDAAERQALHDELAALNIAVHQPDDRPLFTAQPKPAMQPCHWRAADISAMLERIGAHLKLEAGGNRRTLRLTNPGLPYGTTPTLWASIQYILPGEIATSHRHAASALRFVMQGSGTDTIVDGEQYVMNEGDLVLTPSMQFHDPSIAAIGRWSGSTCWTSRSCARSKPCSSNRFRPHGKTSNRGARARGLRTGASSPKRRYAALRTPSRIPSTTRSSTIRRRPRRAQRCRRSARC
jgi:hypothetical protein